MRLKGKKIGVLIESDYYEKEIFYYEHRFPEEGAELHFLRMRGLPDAKSVFPDIDFAPVAAAFGFEARTIRTLEDLRAAAPLLRGPRGPVLLAMVAVLVVVLKEPDAAALEPGVGVEVRADGFARLIALITGSTCTASPTALIMTIATRSRRMSSQNAEAYWRQIQCE